MATIDCITAVLAIPAVEDNGQLRDVLPGEPALAKHFARLEHAFASLAETGPQGSRLDAMLSEFLGRPVCSSAAELSWYEKKGTVYPAIILPTSGLCSPDGEPLATAVTERFRDDDARSRLAELFGRALQVEWASVFVTFGPGS